MHSTARLMFAFALCIAAARTSAASRSAARAASAKPAPAQAALAQAALAQAALAQAALAAPAEPPTSAPSAPGTEWTSTSRARVAVPLPPDAPMATDLTSRAAPPKWTDVPLPPPPALGASKAPAAAGATSASSAKTAAALSTPQTGAAVAAPQAAASSPAGAFTPSVFQPLGPASAQAEGGAQPDAPADPKVKLAADQTGVMLSVTQDLESDKIRQSWAESGGEIGSYEANAGMTIMYKDLSQQLGAGAYMSGVGVNGGFRVSLLSLTPPKYETRDRNWTAFKLGAGMDLGVLGVTINIPVTCAPYVGCIGGPQSASMTTMTLVGTLGFMRAFGSFDSPNDWSGFAIGAEWAPSYQSNTLTDESGTATTTTSFNATGFALNFESGSLKAMASKMGKKARLKVRLFILPPVGELPLLMTASVGAVWY